MVFFFLLIHTILMTLQTVVYIINLKNSYSIFRRTTGFGKLDSLFLFFRRVFSAPSAVSFCLLFVPSTGLPKGEIIFISTAGGDQEPSFLVVLQRKRRNKIGFFFLPTVFSRGKKLHGITKINAKELFMGFFVDRIKAVKVY